MTPWTAPHQTFLSFTISQSLFKLMSIESAMHPIVSSSFAPFSSCLQSFPASESFPVSQLFASGGQSVGASPSASVLPMNIQGWFPLELTGLISLQSKGLSRVFSSTAVRKYQFLGALLYGPALTSIHDYWKKHSLTLWTFVSKVMSLLFNTMSDLVFTKAGLWVTGAQSVTHAQSCLATQSAHGSCFSLKSFSLWSGRLCPQVAMGSFSFLGKATLD